VKHQKKKSKITWMSSNLENTSTCQTSLPKTSYKRKKAKEAELKGTPRILMPPKGQQNLVGGSNSRGKPNETKQNIYRVE